MTDAAWLRSLRTLSGDAPAFDPARAPADPVVLFRDWLADAVARGARDAAGVTGAFTRWIKAGVRNALQGFFIARDPQRATRAGFDAVKLRAVADETFHRTIESLETFQET